MIDGDIRRRQPSEHFLVEGELALARQNGGYAVAPGGLHRREDARLVVDQDVMIGRIPPLDVIQGLFLMDIDQYLPLYHPEIPERSTLRG